jgi:hypothetical protein
MNKRRKYVTLKEGTYAMVFQPTSSPDGSPSKLELPWVGPVRLEKRVRAKDYRVRFLSSGKSAVLHLSRLTPASTEPREGVHDEAYGRVERAMKLHDPADRVPTDRDVKTR